MRVYIEPADWWIGYYRGPNHHYVCPLPTVVLRWDRKSTRATTPPAETDREPEEGASR